MELLKTTVKKVVIMIVLISLLITFIATPSSYADLDIEEGEFYYTGTTKATYAPTKNIFDWLLNALGDIADWLLGIMTLGFRMVFVGWTALLEKMLTWALESTTGLNADGTVVESSTDLTGLTNSSNNVTVEAIVYNKVPALSIDFFDLEYDRNRSGTGNELICKTCEKPASECCPYNLENIDTMPPENKETPCTGTSCGCKVLCCDDCKTYVVQLLNKEPLIIKLRKLVATWYTIMRLLALAAMLVVLIGVGIKMALSTIASDKAVYKRMLVDWVVGIIMIFTLHYFMIFVIHMNTVMVDIIKESSNSITKVQLNQMAEEGEQELTSAELEIKVYEEIRTRAYDPKLSNGLIGMVMYMTLVFMAFKYTLIYLKRLLTILVLTLMAPGVGVAYALQKVLSGKSQALKTWMTEYIMNVIIQIVHALIYAIFISQALVLSLSSVAGMIIALVLMNYSTKADELFKKIFKFGGGDSLVGHTANANQSTMQNLQSAKAIATGAKPLAKALTNTPYGKAVKAAGKAALAGGVAIGSAVGKAVGTAAEAIRSDSEERRYEDEVSEEDRALIRGDNDARLEGESDADFETRRDEAIEKAEKEFPDDVALIVGTQGLEAAIQRINNSDKSDSEKEEKLEALNQRVQRYEKATTVTTGRIVKGHAKRLFDIKNEFKIQGTKGTKGLGNAATIGQRLLTTGRNVGAVKNGVFGTVHFDKNKMKFVRSKDAVYNQFSASNLLGFTDDDKKVFKEHVVTPIAKGFIGMGSLFLGMGTVVMNPKLGMGLLATGTTLTAQTLKKPTGINSYKGKYTFSRFSIPTMNKIKDLTISQVREEQRHLTASTLSGTFKQNLKDGNLRAVTLGAAFMPIMLPAQLMTGAGKLAANTVLHPVKTTKAAAHTIAHPIETVGNVARTELSDAKEIAKALKESIKDNGGEERSFGKGLAVSAGKGVAAVPVGVAKGGLKAAEVVLKTPARFATKTAIADHLEAVDLHSRKQQRKQEKQFKEDAAKLISVQAAAEINALEQDLIKAENDDALVFIWKDAGYNYDPKTGMLTKIETTKATETTRKVDVKIDDIKTEDTMGITQTDVVTIDKEIDRILLEVASGGELDINSEKTQQEIMRILDTRLSQKGLLRADQKAVDIFKKGSDGLLTVMKKKTVRNNMDAAAKNIEEVFEANEVKQISDIVSELTKAKAGTAHVTSDEVLSRLNPNADGSSRAPTGDGSQDIAKNAAVSQYIRARERVHSAARTERSNKKGKLQQAMAAVLDVDIGDEQVTKMAQDKKLKPQDIIEQIYTSEEGSQSKVAGQILEKLFEIKAANEIAVKDLGMTKGTKGYASAKKKKSKLKIEVLEDTRAIAETKITGETKTSAGESVEKVTKRIKANETKLERADKDMKLAGPVYDINDFIKNNLGK